MTRCGNEATRGHEMSSADAFLRAGGDLRVGGLLPLAWAAYRLQVLALDGRMRAPLGTYNLAVTALPCPARHGFLRGHPSCGPWDPPTLLCTPPKSNSGHSRGSGVGPVMVTCGGDQRGRRTLPRVYSLCTQVMRGTHSSAHASCTVPGRLELGELWLVRRPLRLWTLANAGASATVRPPNNQKYTLELLTLRWTGIGS